ncbi:LysR family transcriptional regulator [Klebsiella pneumoniae subsp. pneumoniae]|nr:LysR family transcriptional regulator [Klebsiella pneumoniae subsp. pneumoniae]
MKLRHLEIFYAVMTCGSLSRAAEALNISQPAASKGVKSAEMKLGFTPVSAGARQAAAYQRGAITLFEKSAEHLSGPDNLRLLADNLAPRSARQDHFRLSAKPWG